MPQLFPAEQQRVGEAARADRFVRPVAELLHQIAEVLLRGGHFLRRVLFADLDENIVEPLLGVDTNTLALDYLATGFCAGITDANFSYSAAVGLFKSVVSLILVLTANKITNKLDAGGLW